MILKYRIFRIIKSTGFLWRNRETRSLTYVPNFSPVGFTTNKPYVYITTKFQWAFKSFMDVRGRIDFYYYRGKQIFFTIKNRKTYIPEVGEIIQVTEGHMAGNYRVTHYERTLPVEQRPGHDAPIKNQIAYDILSSLGKTRAPREWCRREQADKIHGAGICGIIIEPSKVKVIGSVKRSWKKEHLEEAIRVSNAWAGQRIWA